MSPRKPKYSELTAQVAALKVAAKERDDARAYVERAIASFADDPADSQFQKGFLAALEAVRDRAFAGR